MEFKNREHLLYFLSNLSDIGFGSQGVCYFNSSDNNVYKIYHQFFDDVQDEDLLCSYDADEILRFSDIENGTFVWPSDVIKVQNEVVGYKSKYANALPLYKINPLKVNLDKFSSSIEKVRKDIDIISENKVLTYDVVYNILYGDKFYIIDQDDYTFSDDSISDIRNYNNINFDIGLYYFLVDGVFQSFVDDNKILKEMYDGKETSVLEFLKEFRKALSENVGKKVIKLSDAMRCVDIEHGPIGYQRNLF